MNPTVLNIARSLLRARDGAYLDRVAERSFLDYHAPGMDYLCLHRSDALTAKIYFIDPARLRTCGFRDYLVHPHDHAYAFDTVVLEGHITNVNFLAKFRTHRSKEHERTKQWRYAAATRSFEENGEKYLQETSRDYLRVGDGYHLNDDKIHTIVVPAGVPTALLLFQYADTRSSTSLFAPAPPDLAGLYRRPSRADVHSLLDSANHYLWRTP